MRRFFLLILMAATCIVSGQSDFALEKTLDAHLARSNSSVLSPDGKTFFVAARSYVHVFDTQTGALLRTLRDSKNPVRELAVSPDGRTLAGGGWLGETVLWNLTDYSVTRLEHEHGSIQDLEFSPDSRLLAAGTFRGTVNLWDVATKQLATLKFTDRLYTLDFSGSGRFLATGDRGGKVSLFELEAILEYDTVQNAEAVAAKQFGPYLNAVHALRFSPDDKYIVASTTTEDGLKSLVYLNVVTGEQEQAIKDVDGAVQQVAFGDAVDSFITANSWEDTASLWRYPEGYRLANFYHLNRVTSAHLASDGKHAYTSGYDTAAYIWNTDGKTKENELALPADSPEVLTLDHSGTTLLTAGQEGDILLWDTATMRLKNTLRGSRGPIKLAAVTREGQVISVGDDDLITLWSEQGRPLDFKRMPEEEAEDLSLSALALSPDGTMLVTGTDEGSLHAWDVSETALTHRYTLNLLEEDQAIHALAFHPDGQSFAAASDPHVVRFYSAAEGERLFHYFTHPRTPRSLAYASDSKRLAVGMDDNIIVLYDLETKNKDSLRKPGADRDRDIVALSFSADGTTLAAVGDDNEATVWDVGSETLVQRLEHENTPGGVALGRDGRTLLVGAGNPLSGGSISVYRK